MITPSRGRQRGWRVHKRLWFGAALLAVALIVMLYVASLFKPMDSRSHEERYIRVTSGQSADQVAVTLHEAGIVRSALAFKVLSRWDGLAQHLTAGIYRLSPRLTLQQILHKMQVGDVVVTKVTIPEGFTVQEIVARLVKAHIGDATDYRVLEHTPLPGMPAAAPGVRDALEGYLFPATYQFPYGTTARQALLMMWQTFQTRVVKGLYDHSGTSLSLRDWVTLSSIVQAEDQKGSQAPLVAAVFFNRLHQGMPLQSDATVRYGIGPSISGGLSLADLAYPSSYNTYLHPGLPPGPIDNPGVVMLRAVLKPSHVPYLYFLSLRNGTILFATTYQQHLANISYAESHNGN